MNVLVFQSCRSSIISVSRSGVICNAIVMVLNSMPKKMTIAAGSFAFFLASLMPYLSKMLPNLSKASRALSSVSALPRSSR